MSLGPIKFIAFRAINEPKLCAEFCDGHTNVLKSFGIDSLTSAKGNWPENPYAYCVVAIVDSKLIGGVRIHLVNDDYILPAVDSLGDTDKNIYKVVNEHSKNGAGEACGLWNSREAAGIGLGFLLSKAIITICDQLDVGRAFALSSDHTIKMFRRIGFRVIRSLGDNGDFKYPSEKYISRLLVVNTKTLSYATPYNKQNMLSLRKKPKQIVFENGNKDALEINYNLKIKSS